MTQAKIWAKIISSMVRSGLAFCGAFDKLTIHTAHRKPNKNAGYEVVLIYL